GSSSLVGLPLARGAGLLLEHPQHPVGDHEATDDVDGTEDDRDEQDDAAHHVVTDSHAEHQHRAEHDDPVDRVGRRHQRRVQRVRHLGDHQESGEPGQHHDGQVLDQHEVFHHASPDCSAVCSGSAGSSDRPATQALSTISSLESMASTPLSSTSSSSSSTTLRAYSSLAWSGISAGRFNGDTMVTSCLTTTRPGSVSSQLPPLSPARSTITLPAFMPCTASAVTSVGALRPGTCAVVITTSNPVIASVSLRCCSARSSSVSSRA